MTMDRGWTLRLTMLLGLCALAVYLLYPSYVYYYKATPEQRDSSQAFCKSLPGWAHCAKLNLGLDLQGGVHLVMGVRVDKALEHRADRLSESVRDSLKAKDLAFVKLERPRDSADIHLTLAQGTAVDVVERLIRKDVGVVDIRRQSPTELVLTMTQVEADSVRDSA
ncbi:MAG: hypothetical protein EOO77_43800, partial [Oxalobacteraceae bacterium]